MLGAVFMCIAALLVTVIIGTFDLKLVWLGLLIMVFALVGTLGRYLRWKTIEFVITTDRIISRTGILAKQGLEIPLERIMNISYSQALWERMLGTGNLVIESAGENGHQSYSDMYNPAHLQNLLYRQMEIASHDTRDMDGMGLTDRQGDDDDYGAYEKRSQYERADDRLLGVDKTPPGGTPAVPPHPRRHTPSRPQSESIPDQIGKLGELRDRGILTEEEFEKKKRQLLDRM